MKICNIPQTELVVSRLGYGAGNLADWNRDPIRKEDIARAGRLVHTVCEQGITLFDHGDVYAFGKAEAVFGEVLKRSPGLRDKIVIQSKCGQCLSDAVFDGPIRVDLSGDYIVNAVEGSLRRLGTDHLDILLLHAPDTLVEPDEVAEAFDRLHRLGKVRYFGVSNYDAYQIALLRGSIRQPLVVNQVPLSLGSPGVLTEGMQFTLWINKGVGCTPEVIAPVRTGTLEYCRLNGIQLQAYGPVREVLNPRADSRSQIKVVARLLAELAKQKGVTPAAIAVAWLLRHPAGFVPILGGQDPKHLMENCAADLTVITRTEWYDLLAAAV